MSTPSEKQVNWHVRCLHITTVGNLSIPVIPNMACVCLCVFYPFKKIRDDVVTV